MYIGDKKILNREYYEHAGALRDKVMKTRIHNEERIRVFHDQDRILEGRKLAAIDHENLRKQNIIDLDHEIDQKLLVAQKMLGLNII